MSECVGDIAQRDILETNDGKIEIGKILMKSLQCDDVAANVTKKNSL
jgi:hypothetical protein